MSAAVATAAAVAASGLPVAGKTSEPAPVSAAHAASTIADVHPHRPERSPSWGPLAVGALGVLVAVEAVIGWAVIS